MSKFEISEDGFVLHACEGRVHRIYRVVNKKEYRCWGCFTEFDEDDKICLIIKTSVEYPKIDENGLLFDKDWLEEDNVVFHLECGIDGETEEDEDSFMCLTCGETISKSKINEDE